MRAVVLVVLLAILGGINASAVTDSRPGGITGATWQYGPLNRWAYTHIREILPTKNIANDNNLVHTKNKNNIYLTEIESKILKFLFNKNSLVIMPNWPVPPTIIATKFFTAIFI